MLQLAESGPVALPEGLSDADLARFQRDGFVVVRNLAPAGLLERLQVAARHELAQRRCPVEFEADLHYPGGPASSDAAGGDTIRRLKQAHSRDCVFTEWLMDPNLGACLERLLGAQVICPLAHHNCVMTKHPEFSSETGWHQDIRFWSFGRPSLISAWLALGREGPENGGLQIIPGSHELTFSRDRLDDALFLRADLAQNQQLIGAAVPVLLEPGDLLLFHCRALHAAGRNRGDAVKLSVVFTFRAADNPPLPGSRSASLPEMLLPPVASR